MQKTKVSACKKFKEHRGQAQQGRLKHLLVTALFGRNEDRQIAVMVRHVARKIHENNKLKKNVLVSACEKYKEHRGQAQRGRLKHLLVTALFGRNEDRHIAGLPSALRRKTHRNKNLKKRFLRAHVKSFNNIGVRPNRHSLSTY